VIIAIVGSRSFNDRELAFHVLDKYVGNRGHSIVTGGARGADALAEEWARNRGIPVQVLPAEWEKYGRSAGSRRNTEIVRLCQGMIAFWDGKSPGTRDSIRKAQGQGKKIVVVRITQKDVKPTRR